MKINITTYCGLECDTCEYREKCHCGGCIATGGKPFHGKCDVANCAVSKGVRFCGECADFPCETLKRYSYDAEQGDNGARIEHCKEQKHALVAQAREGLDPIGYCGHHCDHCFLGEFCGGCRSDYDCCSYATICEGGICPNAACVKEKQLDGCWQCEALDDCPKGYFSADDGYIAKAAALFIREYGKKDYDLAHQAIAAAGKHYPKSLPSNANVSITLQFLCDHRPKE